MAPQRGADGLLETLRKAPSTRLCLVLGVAALLALAGCGGGSEDPESGAGESSTATAPQKGEGSESSTAKPDPESAQLAKERAAAEAAIEGKSPSGGQGGKKGPQIKPPKGPQERGPTPQQRAEATVVSMALASPVIGPGGPESTGILPATYTCDGKNTPPPLVWQGVPAGTQELVLLALNLEPVNEAFFFDWAVAGIDPQLEGLASGELPQGAVQGKNGFGKNGYSLCPASRPETIIFALYAMPAPTGAKRGFDPARLREEVLETSGDAGIMAVSYGG